MKVQSYWSSIVIKLTVIFGVPIRMDPTCLILGLPDCRITDSKHRRLFNILTFAARKNILLFWNKNVAPTKKSWHNIVMDCIPREYITCMLHSKIDAFCKVWDPYLQHIGQMCPLSFIFIFLIIFYLLYPHCVVFSFSVMSEQFCMFCVMRKCNKNIIKILLKKS